MPKPTSPTCQPVRPKVRWSIDATLHVSIADRISNDPARGRRPASDCKDVADMNGRRRRFRAEVAPLEGRDLTAVLGLTVSASPQVLRHPNVRNQPHPFPTDGTVAVTLAGEVFTDINTAPSVRFR